MWRTIRPRRVCSRATCAAARAAGAPWLCAEFWPTRMRQAWSRNCATASTPGGACPSRENEAAALLRSPGRWRKRGPPPGGGGGGEGGGGGRAGGGGGAQGSNRGVWLLSRGGTCNLLARGELFAAAGGGLRPWTAASKNAWSA